MSSKRCLEVEDQGKSKEQLIEEIQKLREQVRSCENAMGEHQQVDKLLRESEARYRLLAENITDVIWTMDLNLQLTYVSPSVTYQSGRSVEEAMAMTLEEMFPPDSLAIVTQAIAEEFAMENNGEGNPYRSRTIEVEMWHKDGSTRWTEITASFLRNPGGQPVGIVGLTRDISERKRIEKVLTREREFYKRLSEQNPDALVVVDADNKIIYQSHGTTVSFCVPPGAVQGEIGFDYIHPDDLPQVVESFVGLLQRPGDTISGECRTLHGDGTWRYIQYVSRNCLDDPAVQGVIVTTRDVTEQRQAVEKALQESENRYRLMADNIVDVLFTIDTSMRFTYMSPSIKDMLGYTPDEAIGLSISEILTPDSRVLSADAIQLGLSVCKEALAAQNAAEHDPSLTQALEMQLIHKDGSTVWVDVRASFLFDHEGKVIGLQGLARDMTQRRNAEEEVGRLTSAVEQSIDGIAIGNLEPRLTYVNDAFARMHGYSPEEMLGLNVGNIYNLNNRKQRGEYERGMDNLRTHGSWTGEGEHGRKDGSLFPAYISATLLKNRAGEPTGILAVVRDITDLKEAQATVHELERKHEMAVLEERNRMAREIHDTLAQGLTGIIWQLTAAERALQISDGEAGQHIASARSLAKESLSEARRSVQDLRPQALEQLPLAKSLEMELRRFSDDDGMNVEFNISGKDRPLATQTETALLRICQESLNNVKKHACASRAVVQLSFKKGSVNMTVQDNGVGFDPESPPKGGFGLVSMSERARLAGGTLEIRSERGKGTWVEVSLPISKEKHR